MTHDYEHTWHTYASAWAAPTTPEKMKLMVASLAKDCRYTDPLTTCDGYEALLSYMAEFHRQIPGGHFKTKWFLAYQGRSIALWDLCDAHGNKHGEGASYGSYDEAGKLTSMTGFFETPG